MQHLARLHLELIRPARATLRGCAQLAFCDTPFAGVLVLGGITLASPFSGLGALLGAAFGTVVGRFVSAYSRDDWSWGLASFNPAIVGLFFGGFLASGERHPALLVPILALTVMLDAGFRRVLAQMMLPALSAAAVATIYVVTALAAPPGGWFWTDAPTNPLVPLGVLGGGCIVVAMAIKSPFPGLWAVLLSAITALSCWLAGHDPRAALGLWAITVPLASFGVHAIFLRGSLAGCVAGTLAALLGALVWLAWETSFLKQWLPPLLVPFILGTWLSMVSMRRVMASPLAGSAFWCAARALFAARAARRDVIGLLAAGATSDHGLSTYFSGEWLGAERPRFAFERESLRASPRCRREFWAACARLRENAKHLRASGCLWRVGRLQRRGWVRTTIVSDPLVPIGDALPGGALRLHGDLRITRCMECGAEGTWPPQSAWQSFDLRCARCQGPVVPAMTLFGAPADEFTVAALRDVATRCAAILVLGDHTGEPEIRRLVDQARYVGAATIFVSEHPISDGRQPADICVHMSAERFLAWVDVVLAVGYALSGSWMRGDARRETRTVDGKHRREAA